LTVPLPLAGRSAAARGASAAFQSAISRRGPVLIEAEGGCCSQEIASALHAHSRPAQPFVVSDCRVDDALGIEQRLFGTAARSGELSDLESATAESAVVLSGAGTLFVDNIDELPAAAQRRLARLLRDGEVRFAGRTIRTGFRLVAATSRDLANETREGRFREDLLRRLARCRITIVPLRRRPTDIPEILNLLCRDLANGATTHGFTAQAVAVLASLPWTRNFDELRECVGNLLKGQPAEVTAERVLAQVSLPGHFGRMDLTASLREARRQFEREYIGAVLEHHRWSMSEAARTLGIERANLYRKARQLGITRGIA
jgi:anaerobic nitric oxide reductase transcription regulator